MEKEKTENWDKIVYNTLKDMYIDSYLYDEVNHMLYVTSATGKKLTVKKPSELIVNLVRNKYMETGGELKRKKKEAAKEKAKRQGK